MPAVRRNAARDGCLSKNIEIDQNNKIGIYHGFQKSHGFPPQFVWAGDALVPNISCLENSQSFHVGEEFLTFQQTSKIYLLIQARFMAAMQLM